MDHRNLLVFDADGVMLNYNESYAKAWSAAFGETPVRVRENCYPFRRKTPSFRAGI